MSSSYRISIFYKHKPIHLREISLKWSSEFIRYTAVGVATNALGFAIYVLFTRLGVSPVLTISIFYPVQISSAFYCNKKWSFKHQGRLSASVVRYLIAYVGCYMLNVITLKFFSGYCGYSHLIVQAIAIFVIAILLFLTQKYWVFSVHGSKVSSVLAL